MAANVETALELGLREAAETVWARKLIVEALGPVPVIVPLERLVDAAAAHGKAVGRAEGVAYSLELLRDDGIRGEELLETALREIGGSSWDRSRVELCLSPGLNLGELLDLIDAADTSWGGATVVAARHAPHTRIIRPL